MESTGTEREASGSKPDAFDDLKTLPVAEVEKRLGSSPDGLTQAEAEKRLTQYGPNEIVEKKVNPLLKFLTYFWGPIPWMIEAAVILSGVLQTLARLLHHPRPAPGQRRNRVLGRAPGGQSHRRPEGRVGDQGPCQTGRRMGHSTLA